MQDSSMLEKWLAVFGGLFKEMSQFCYFQQEKLPICLADKNHKVRWDVFEFKDIEQWTQERW